jgi:uncharacterized protein (DUF924 family)
MEVYQKILEYWFGNLQIELPPLTEKYKLWFTKSDETDQFIIEKFSKTLESVSVNYAKWQQEPESCLALIILFDQFTRNIFRGNSKSFFYDNIALDSALLAIKSSFEQKFNPVKRIFFYLPLEHSESLEIQKLSLKKFQEFVNENPGELTENYYKFAMKHYEIIDRFGRFPHRNIILGRESTPEEIKFLQQPGSSF